MVLLGKIFLYWSESYTYLCEISLFFGPPAVLEISDIAFFTAGRKFYCLCLKKYSYYSCQMLVVISFPSEKMTFYCIIGYLQGEVHRMQYRREFFTTKLRIRVVPKRLLVEYN